MEVLAEHSVDLFALLPLGELWVAAVRMRQVEQLRHTLERAFALLDSLGNPALWSTPCIGGRARRDPRQRAGAGGAARSGPRRGGRGQHAGAHPVGRGPHLAAGTGHPGRRRRGHRGGARSRTYGLTSDATRLTGQAALQTPDGKVSGAMLQLARDLKVGATPDEAPGDQTHSAASPSAQPPSGSALTQREREVAELLLLGMPYRDIGTQLSSRRKRLSITWPGYAADWAPGRAQRCSINDPCDACSERLSRWSTTCNNGG